MPEIQRPDFAPPPSGGSGDSRFLLLFLVMCSMLLFGYPYVSRHAASAPPAKGPAASQMLRKEVVNAPAVAAGSHSIASADNFGWLAFIARPLDLALRFLHGHGIRNWGWAIIALTAMFNLLTVWPRILSMKSSLRMMRVQPQVDAIKKRYAHLALNDPKRAEMNVEMMALYKAEGANMFGGCLPLLLQMPLLFAYVRVLRGMPELHQAHWYWLTDLSSPDPLHLLPLLIVASMLVTQLITPAPGMTSSQRWMVGMAMPVVMGFSLWHYASGLSLYWITGNLVNLLIQLAVNQSKTGKEMHALSAERAATKTEPG